jgi:hypothetical protein
VDSGKTVLNFSSGSAQRLTSTAESWAAGSTHTQAFVIKPNLAGNNQLLDFSSGRLFSYYDALRRVMMYDGAFTPSGVTSLVYGVWNWLLVESDAAANLWRVWANGVAVAAVAYATPRAFGGTVRFGGNYLNGANALDGRVATVAARTGAILSASEKADLSRAIVAKYAAFGLSRGDLT